MTDPLQLAAALDFLASSPAPRMALSPATGKRRRFLLEDSGAALAFLAAPDLPTPAQRAAPEDFELVATV